MLIVFSWDDILIQYAAKVSRKIENGQQPLFVTILYPPFFQGSQNKRTVGGLTNPFEKCLSKCIIFPGRGKDLQ